MTRSTFITLLCNFTLFSILLSQDIQTNGFDCVSDSGKVTRVLSAYTDSGNVARRTSQFNLGDGWVPVYRESLTYDGSGQLTRFSTQNYIDSIWVDSTTVIKRYTDDGQLSMDRISVYDRDGNILSSSRSVFMYNSDGLQTRRTEQDMMDEQWLNRSRVSTTYIEDSLTLTVLTESFQDTLWKNVEEIKNKYNASNVLTSMTSTVFNDDGDEDDDIVKTLLMYTDDGKVRRRTVQQFVNGEWINSTREVITFDADGQVMLITTSDFIDDVWIESLKEQNRYDADGNISNTTFTMFVEGEIDFLYRIVSLYNEDGQTTRSTYQIFLNGEWVNVNRDVTSYTEDGLIASSGQAIYVDGAWVDLESLKYNYSDDGDLNSIETTDFSADCGDAFLEIDVDMDGFTSDIDCNDSDASINPGEVDIPNNGIDEDCSGRDSILLVDADMDGFTSDVDCNDNDARVNPDADEVEGNDIDENCDGRTFILADCGDDSQEDSLSVSISGSVVTETDLILSDAVLTLSSAEEDISTVTDASGEYRLRGVPKGFNYQISADKEAEAAVGVTTLDLVFVQRHIIAADTLSPYKMISADVSGDERISVSDIVAMRRLVLGIDEEWGEGSAWYFVPAEVTFIDRLNPWPYNESIVLDSLNTSMCHSDFIAIKRGDVNNSYEVKLKGTSESRSIRELEYSVHQIAGGTEYRFYYLSDDSLVGFQFGLKGVKEAVVNSRAIQMDKTNIHIKDDKLFMSWHDAGAYDKLDDVLFTLLIPSGHGTDLELLDTDFDHELYMASSKDIEAYNLVLMPSRHSNQAFHVAQNKPNPFNSHSVIDITVNVAGDFELSVISPTAEVLFNETQYFNKGLHSISIDSEILNGTGIYFYKLSSGKTSVIHKMCHY